MDQDEILQQLEKLAELKSKGILTEEEYAEQKRILLSNFKSNNIDDGSDYSLKSSNNESSNDSYKIAEDLKKLDPNLITAVELRVASEKKSIIVCYLIWFFLGTLGIHNFYLGKTRRAITELVTGLLLISYSIWGIGMGSSYALGFQIATLWFLVVFLFNYIGDIFLIPKFVREYNDSIRAKYMLEYNR